MAAYFLEFRRHADFIQHESFEGQHVVRQRHSGAWMSPQLLRRGMPRSGTGTLEPRSVLSSVDLCTHGEKTVGWSLLRDDALERGNRGDHRALAAHEA